MKFREKLADWLTGGALSAARKEAADWEAQFDLEASDVNMLSAALASIIAMETPSANATVKRMAKAAREALN